MIVIISADYRLLQISCWSNLLLDFQITYLKSSRVRRCDKMANI
jgi:hypothetical protein